MKAPKKRPNQKGILKTSSSIDLNILNEHLDNLNLSDNNDLNFWLYCKIAIHSGLRSIDILNLETSKINFEDKSFTIQEQKTKKFVKVCHIPNVVLDNINKGQDFVIWNTKYKRNVSLMTINRRLKLIFPNEKNISSHSIRKAKAKLIYNKTNKDIIKAMIFLNHSSPLMTKNYLNISQEERDFLYTIN